MVPLLLIQSVSLTWDKSSRGGTAAEARRRFPQAFPLEGGGAGEIVLHRLRFCQRGTAFLDELAELRLSMEQAAPKLGLSPEQARREIQKRHRVIQQYRVQAFQAASELNLTNLGLRPEGEGFAVSFFYDEHRSGAPYRRGRNQDYADPRSPFYCKDCLNEPAFRLGPGQYGRILWNERRTDCDTGEWYYLLHVYNLFCLTRPPGRDLLTGGRPDFVYSQLADLRGLG